MFFDFSTTRLFEYLPKIIIPALFATLRMLFFSMILGFIIGTIVAVLLVITSPYGLKPNKRFYKIFGFV